MQEKAFVEAERKLPEFINVLGDVCRLESPTANKEAVDCCGAYFAEFAKKRNWDVKIEEIETAGNPICITMNPEGKLLPIALSGHIDTVHPIGFFGKDCVKIDGSAMRAPGCVDCKGGVVIGLLAMDALREAGYVDRPIKMIIQTDEETGSKTSGKKTVKFMLENAKDCTAFFNLEGNSNFTSCTLVRKGILRFCLHVKGKAVHSSKCYTGSNAILEACHKIIELEKYKDPAGITCNCGVINGGTVANTVAEECSFLADFRYFTSEEEAQIREKIQCLCDNHTLENCSCSAVEVSSRPGMPLSDRNLELFDKVNKILEQLGYPPLKWQRANGGSDAAYVTAAGIPCLDNLGMLGDGIHSNRETCKLDTMLDSAKRLIGIILGL